MGSYALHFFGKKIFGKRWYEKRIMKLHLRNAERVKRSILQLEGLFIKIGQLLSILGTFLPEEFQKPLEDLQDKIPPRPFAEVQERIVKEFGKLPKEVFSTFEEMPIASASIGQAHRATLPDGTQVVVKVQHANIEQVAQVDLRIIKRLTNIIAWFFDIKGMDYMYTQIRKMIEEELDFAREARSMQQIADNLKDEVQFVIPAIHPEYSTARTLTTTWHEGVKISNTAQLDAWGLDRRDILTRLLRAYCRMVFMDGFYHADPHPGNILVKPDGTLVLLDFGAVDELSQALRQGIPQLIEAAVKSDTDAMIKAARSMGFFAQGQEAEKMAGKMIDAFRNFLQNEIKLEGLNFKDIELDPLNNSLFDLISEIGFSGISGTVQVPKDWVLLNRMITLLLGISTTLDPQLNPLDVVRPYIKEFVVGEKESLVSFVTGLLRRTVATTLALPDELHRVLQRIDRGKLETRTPDIREGAKLLYQVGQQFVLAFLSIAAATFGYLFYSNGHIGAARWGFGLCGFFMLLFLRALRVGGRIWRRLE
ncbi:MAG: AarF/ABC1/UbiB kinase family protein [Saprospiraceae bacterium]|nr:AarF/ABC1/UbiB kinase family protein [Saprospiraceae bacterium]